MSSTSVKYIKNTKTEPTHPPQLEENASNTHLVQTLGQFLGLMPNIQGMEEFHKLGGISL